MNTQKLTTEEFIERAVEKHGDRYDYSNSIYINSRTPINIGCKIHGFFKQKMAGHLNTSGCAKCGIDKYSTTRTLTEEEFLLRLPKDREYNVISEYKGFNYKIKVSDKYGEYEMAAKSLIEGSLPTMVSAIDKTKYIINKAEEVHNHFYDYSLVEYNREGKIIIICKDHGQFKQHFSQHFLGAGCRKCMLAKREKPIDIRLANFIEKAKVVHNNIYSYIKSDYIDEENKTTIICNMHGEYIQDLSIHLSGKGCYSCGRGRIVEYLRQSSVSWDYTSWINAGKISKRFDSFKVYIIKCWDEKEEFYKIGKTFSTTKNRFKTKKEMPYSFEILHEFVDENARNICELEWTLKNCNKNNSYIPVKEFGGRYECFKELDISCFEEYKLEINN